MRIEWPSNAFNISRAYPSIFQDFGGFLYCSSPATMTSLVPTQRLLVLLALACSASAYSNHIWHKAFENSDKWTITRDNCTAEYEGLNRERYQSHTSDLVDCT